MATTQEAVQISTIVPALTVDDLQKSITFYEALGFAIDERWEEKGTLLGVMMRAGSTEIGLNQDDWKKGRDRKKGVGVRLSISTTRRNVDEHRHAGQESGHQAQVGTARHGVEDPRVRGQRSERLPADDLFRDGVAVPFWQLPDPRGCLHRVLKPEGGLWDLFNSPSAQLPRRLRL